MKKRIIGIVVVLLAVCIGVSAANENQGAQVEAGVKGRYDRLKLNDPETTNRFDATVLLGPAVKVKLPSGIFFDASYLLTLADYEHSLLITTVKADRKDLELAVGYQIVPQLAAYIGYKNAKSEISTIFGNAEFKLYGGLLGLRADLPVSEMVSVYANAAYLRTRFKATEEGTSETEKAPGYDAELGVKMQFRKNVSGSVGYRMETTEGKVSKIEETFTGITFGALYAFE
jgi:opacity protein-like surface antigen